MNTDTPKPREYQRVGVERLRQWGSAILADEQGLGKTAQAYWHAARNVRGTTLVVCFASLKENWRREALQFTGLRAHVIDGRRPYDLPPAAIYIINFDILGDPEKDGDDVWTRYIIKHLPLKLLIIDECQAIRNWESKRSRACRTIAVLANNEKGVQSRLGLSGTPIENRPAEFYPIIRIVKPELFPSQKEYLDRYCGPEEKPWGREYKGASNTEELHKIITDPVNGCLIRRRKKDVMKDLPPIITSVLPMVLPKKAMAEYQFAHNDFIAWLIRTYGQGERVDAAANAERLVRFSYLKMLAAKLKFPLAIDHTKNWLDNSDKKLLGFGWHRGMILGMQNRFVRSAVTVGGWVPAGKRQPLFDSFNHDAGRRLFLGQLQAAGAGWNCTAADDVLFYELAWMPTLHSQAIARCHGLARGTGAGVTATFMVAAGTIEEDLCKVLQMKQNILDMILDGRRFHELNVYDLLTRHYLETERSGIKYVST